MREVKRGELYCANLSPVMGSEQGGVRPVIVLQNDVGNKYSPTTIVAAITGRKNKAHIPTHIPIRSDVLQKDSLVMLEQIRTVDKNRLGEFIGQADEQTMQSIDDAISISLGMNGFGSIHRIASIPKATAYMRVATKEQLSDWEEDMPQFEVDEEENGFVQTM